MVSSGIAGKNNVLEPPIHWHRSSNDRWISSTPVISHQQKIILLKEQSPESLSRTELKMASLLQTSCFKFSSFFPTSENNMLRNRDMHKDQPPEYCKGEFATKRQNNQL